MDFKEIDKNKDKGDWIVTGMSFALAAITYFIGHQASYNKFEPKNVYLKDLNKNGRMEIVVERAAPFRRTESYIFLQQYDGIFKRLDEVLEMEKDSLEQKVLELK